MKKSDEKNEDECPEIGDGAAINIFFFFAFFSDNFSLWEIINSW